MPAILILGASRGLGLGLVQEYRRRGWDVVATRRGPAPELERVPGVTVETVDIDDAGQVATLADRLAGRRFDIVFLNAGVMSPRGRSAATVTPDEFQALMWTNSIAPVRAARLLLPLATDTATIAFMSSVMGSIEATSADYGELYRASKAALNSLARSFAVGAGQGRPVLSVHPGWVRTAMGGETAPLDVDTSVRGIADMVAAETAPGHRFVDYQGATIPW